VGSQCPTLHVATAKVSDSNKHPSLLKNKIDYDHKQVYSRDPRSDGLRIEHETADHYKAYYGHNEALSPNKYLGYQ
jgi:hypothetical protein